MIFEDIQRIIHEDMGEKVVASLVLSDEGNLIVQYGDKIIVYKNAVSARPASELLKIVADFIN
ncbi:hypothetical protein OL330_000865 [Vibrio parahaemolyticus]|uniref:hypothetical protein n=1 Tax=uncultured Vibrio sp. TaxID=114054 RepID=UPI001A318173|nr:hypothetical protein [uncultured Vibrio sp.]EGQ8007514.1 hypothetical protein [Vibrio parahaemolyticus]EHK2868501.1 hypothetical protein [Vibrio parahaemolyticus]EKA7371676.1 hypothetical protein [Vibrio parahaemolyticus]ELA9375740.1 hypothetical protein [Vibrio parahaemolyticus]HAS6902102.1 hypothetical protein [Vibrio parahaemolyticus]